ncbi:GNS1/SUR4 family-domain-containing protein [Xylogone sp. PMI_703]|nr:GNS1/SUR4 family-domain-containing protein [Xylogone sp. PMI_703]
MSQTMPLWQGFSKAMSLVSEMTTKGFEFVPGKTPMATLTETLSAIGLYYVLIFGGRKIMEGRPAFKLQRAFMVHNFYLTVISSGLLALFLEQLIPSLWKAGVFCNICRTEYGWTNRLEVLYYLNYLTKYLEFLDTCFLVLRKKPLTFLHTYHHGATAFLCYTQLVGQTPVSWVPITLNLTVHTVMYFYYFQSARGVRCWWKEYITIMQIVQFIIDLGFIYFCAYRLRIFALSDNPCDGGTTAALTGVVTLTSYLFLFIAFYFTTYKTGGKVQKKQLKAVAFAESKDNTTIAKVSAIDPLVAQGRIALGKVHGVSLRMADRDRA